MKPISQSAHYRGKNGVQRASRIPAAPKFAYILGLTHIAPSPAKGLTFARQAGFAATTGELIANVDSDSRLTSGWVDQVLKAFSEQPNLVTLSGPLGYYDLTPRERFGV